MIRTQIDRASIILILGKREKGPDDYGRLIKMNIHTTHSPRGRIIICFYMNNFYGYRNYIGVFFFKEMALTFTTSSILELVPRRNYPTLENGFQPATY